jgi:hypothetical protein
MGGWDRTLGIENSDPPLLFKGGVSTVTFADLMQRSVQGAIHIAIHNNDAYDVLPMTYSAVRALLCR